MLAHAPEMDEPGERKQPVGELLTTGNVRFLGRSVMREWDRRELSSAMQLADEFAFVECLDEAGQHWTLVIDGAVFRAAVSSWPDEIREEDTVRAQKNWWVEKFLPEHILMRLPGWEADWKADPNLPHRP